MDRKQLLLTKVLLQLGLEEQSAVVHIQALYPADGILLGISSKHRLLIINLNSFPGGQLVNSPTAAILDRCAAMAKHYNQTWNKRSELKTLCQKQ